MPIAALALPFTFIPLLVVANDRDYMGAQRNTPAMNFIAAILIALLVLVAIAAVPLFFLTSAGGT